ncbi:dihydrodipicolinate synthase family protein [Candidatus Bathyarchaeota archaeon]|nr:dihydrodipicolinate synthase family protein [Candidatus Bathyarchaeota archaeon]
MVEIPNRAFGLIPATLTPMNKNFEVDYGQLEEYIKWLLTFKIGGLAVNVDTGEGPHLFNEEKIRIVNVVSEIVKGKVPVIAGLHARNTQEAINSAKETKDAGADGLLVFPHPAFIGYPSEEIIYEYHNAISEKVDIPLVLFNLQPALGGVEYTPETLQKLSKIKNVVALKEASFDARKFIEIARTLKSLPRKITLLTGNDNFIYESLILGAEGGLLGFGTIAVEEQTEMFELIGKGKYHEAREIWEKLLPLENVIFAHPVRNYRARLKEALAMMGIIKTTYVRPPLTPISKEEREKLRDVLKDLKML